MERIEFLSKGDLLLDVVTGECGTRRHWTRLTPLEATVVEVIVRCGPINPMALAAQVRLRGHRNATRQGMNDILMRIRTKLNPNRARGELGIIQGGHSGGYYVEGPLSWW